jgi:hypothetical protein
MNMLKFVQNISYCLCSAFLRAVLVSFKFGQTVSGLFFFSTNVTNVPLYGSLHYFMFTSSHDIVDG